MELSDRESALFFFARSLIFNIGFGPSPESLFRLYSNELGEDSEELLIGERYYSPSKISKPDKSVFDALTNGDASFFSRVGENSLIFTTFAEDLRRASSDSMRGCSSLLGFEPPSPSFRRNFESRLCGS